MYNDVINFPWLGYNKANKILTYTSLFFVVLCNQMYDLRFLEIYI